jgi:hypothetical protein
VAGTGGGQEHGAFEDADLLRRAHTWPTRRSQPSEAMEAGGKPVAAARALALHRCAAEAKEREKVRQGGTRRFGVCLGVAMVTGLAVLTATAFATSADGMIDGCYSTAAGDLRVINDPETCRPNETALSWSQAGITGYEIMVTDTAVVPVGVGVGRSARCSLGKRLLGGSYHANNVRILQSFPQASGASPGWQVFVQTDFGEPGSVTAYAICA